MTEYKKIVLVTGGLGFIGQALLDKLLKDDWEVRILDNLSNPSITEDDVRKLGVDVHVGDIRDRSVCDSAVNGCDVVIHLAGQTYVAKSVEDPYQDLDINGVGTLNLLEASKKYKISTFIAASSNAVAGLHPPPFNEQAMPSPMSPYGCSKLLIESYCHAYAQMYNIRTVALRFSNIYGPGSWRKGSVVATFIRQILMGESVVIDGDGKQTRDFLHIDDISQAIMKAIEKGPAGSKFCIGSGTKTTINKLVDQLEIALDRQNGSELIREYGPDRQGDIKDNWSDISHAKSVLGFSPTLPLDVGLEQTLSWFINKWLPESKGKD